MAYTRTQWEEAVTPLSAQNMNNIEDGVEEALGLCEGNSDMWEYIRNLVYPVGAIYMSVNNTNPGTLFGGTWEAWGAGRVPVGVGTADGKTFAIGETGGQKDAIIPSHNHTATFTGNALGTHGHEFVGNEVANHTHAYSAAAANTGGSTLSVADLAVHSHPLKLSTNTRTFATESPGGGTAAAITSVSVLEGTGSSTGTAGGGGTHRHSIGTTSVASGGGGKHTPSGINRATSAGTPSGSVTVASRGESVTNKNLQPYITCYMWKRTA